MAEYPPNPGPLPARDFCNGWGEGNPVLGKGALGNPDRKHMYYTGNDREKQVTTVQTMLGELGYDVGSSSPDGKFGNNTEKAVMAFQEDHKDWEGEGLKVDGLVGPDTADALNRKMVGKWYDRYRTPAELYPEVALVTAVKEAVLGSINTELTREERVRLVIADADADSLKKEDDHPDKNEDFPRDTFESPEETEFIMESASSPNTCIPEETCPRTDGLPFEAIYTETETSSPEDEEFQQNTLSDSETPDTGKPD